MKSREEIEQLANEEYKDKLHNPFFTAAPMGYIKGYTQCQEDMADKKYTEEDMLKCWNTLMVAQVLNKPIFFSDYIESLKKQK